MFQRWTWKDSEAEAADAPECGGGAYRANVVENLKAQMPVDIWTIETVLNEVIGNRGKGHLCCVLATALAAHEKLSEAEPQSDGVFVW